ncbi:signal peptidase II [Brachybacterium sp. DNPG3]
MSESVSTPASAGPEGSGARRRLSLGAVIAMLAIIAALILVLDQVTKNWAEANLEELVPQPLLGDVLSLTLLYNSGAAWGMGSGATPIVTVLQMLIAVGAVVFTVKAVRSPGYAVALALILGGALGNIHDRLLRPPGPFHGAVVDFLELPNWPVFNVADMAVVGGAILVVLLGILGRPYDPAAVQEERPARSAGPATPGSAEDPS